MSAADRRAARRAARLARQTARQENRTQRGKARAKAKEAAYAAGIDPGAKWTNLLGKGMDVVASAKPKFLFGNKGDQEGDQGGDQGGDQPNMTLLLGAAAAAYFLMK